TWTTTCSRRARLRAEATPEPRPQPSQPAAPSGATTGAGRPLLTDTLSLPRAPLRRSVQERYAPGRAALSCHHKHRPRPVGSAAGWPEHRAGSILAFLAFLRTAAHVPRLSPTVAARCERRFSTPRAASR